jgi:hypothetical protein
MVTQVDAFWDTSVLVPLCLRELTSIHARVLAEQFSPVVW